jgi:hypothetical protein
MLDLIFEELKIYIYIYINRVNDHISKSGCIVLNFRRLLRVENKEEKSKLLIYINVFKIF